MLKVEAERHHLFLLVHAVVLFSIERYYTSQIINNIDQLLIRRHDYFRIMLQGVLRGFQPFQQLGIPDEILVSRLLEQVQFLG